MNVGQFRGRGPYRSTSNAARMAYTAAKYAYKNRDKIAKAVKKVFPNKKRKLQGPARKLGYQGRNTAATTVGSFAQTGNELSTYRRTVGRYPALKPNRLLKLMQAGMTSNILRAQGITNFDTNVGFYPLANRQDQSGFVNMPINIWDLTSYLNTGPAIAGHGYYWNGQTGAADVVSYSLRTQVPDGSSNPAGFYYAESAGGFNETLGSYANATKACHEWSDIRLNLYGARKRGTTFYVDIVRVKDHLAHPIAAAGTNASKKELFRTLQSPLIYSNLQQHNSKNMREMKFVKRYKVYVPGGSADDLDTIGKVKEVKIFLKQGCVYNMAWESTDGSDAIPHAQDDGLDYTQKSGPQNHPFTGSRLLMIVRAFSPERRVVAGFGTVDADPLTEPSYDLILRNKWMLPN